MTSIQFRGFKKQCFVIVYILSLSDEIKSSSKGLAAQQHLYLLFRFYSWEPVRSFSFYQSSELGFKFSIQATKNEA